MKFVAVTGSGLPEAAERAAAVEPVNPFHTPQYIASRQVLGEQPVMLVLEDGGDVVAGCAGFIRSGRLSTQIEVTSAPAVPQTSPWWDGLHAWCRNERIWDLHVRTFGSQPGGIPPMTGEASRESRVEYVLDLTLEDLLSGLHSNNKRNWNKARKAGLRLQRTADPACCDSHHRLVDSSLARREERGERTMQTELDVFRVLLSSGAGELFQATLDNVVVSSILLLHARAGSYYQSAGTSPEGMSCGASAFVIAETAVALRNDGRRQFNLGGAGPENPGLQRYKSGFGCTEVLLEQATFSLMPALMQQARRAASRLMSKFG
jgi:lipid II:glycine glycyltransferase (peptidoglycan interpeptide bridge formation enzyme)